jgi:hypothetical protein
MDGSGWGYDESVLVGTSVVCFCNGGWRFLLMEDSSTLYFKLILLF